MKKLFIIPFLFVQTSFAASEVVWLRFAATYQFRSAEKSCDLGTASARAFLVAEVRNGKIVAAGLSPYPGQKTLWLPQPDLERLQFFRAAGYFWLDSLDVDIRILNWFAQQFHSQMSCEPVFLKALATKSRFDFERSGIPIGVLTSYSQTADFHGMDEDGVSFHVQLRLVQQPYPLGRTK